MPSYLSGGSELPTPRIVGWHLDADPERLCELCLRRAAVVIVDLYGTYDPTEVCENCRPSDAHDQIRDILVAAGLLPRPS